MTPLAPWLTPALVTGIYVWAGISVGIGTLIVLRCAVAVFSGAPDRTTAEEDAEQMAAVSRPAERPALRLVYSKDAA